jgi:hypothetical protein
MVIIKIKWTFYMLKLLEYLSYYCMKPNYDSSSKLSFGTAIQTRKEDREIHPRDLSGD